MIAYALYVAVSALWLAADADDGRGKPQKGQS